MHSKLSAGMVACGIQKGRGISCGQTKNECRHAKKDMVLSAVGAGIDIGGMIASLGSSVSISYSTKMAKVANEVFGWIEKVKLFKES